ncbi:helix-turn-helix domain-containing protein [Emcibacter sp. SYSU 3D8]|uniref:TetR/AcrR family transcriptional regulator n=1 Tax=Emcibacter sp. SYSU 3D8 TaxID=3133969 RepID=UPI0031FEAF25
MTLAGRKPRRSQAERSAASSNAILNAAVELFLEVGTRASMMEIGRRSGFSHGLVMARFGSKDGLIAAVTHEIHRRFRDEVFETLGDARGLAALYRFIDAYCGSLMRNSVSSSTFFVLLGEALGPNNVVRSAFSELDALFRDILGTMIEQAKADGDVNTRLPTAAVTVLLVGMLRGIGVQARVNPGAVDIEAAHDAAHLLLEGAFRP